MSTAITADRERVWRALTTPSELIRWDDQIVALLDPAPDYPNPGQKVRWRYRIGSIEFDAHQTIREIQPRERLQSEISLGLFHFEETYTLTSENGTPDQTWLRLSVVSSNSVPVVGGLMDRFTVRRLSSKLVDSRMRAVAKWCENPS
jgi:uncharacterized protein YndB with AHSA1/START domain